MTVPTRTTRLVDDIPFRSDRRAEVLDILDGGLLSRVRFLTLIILPFSLGGGLEY